MDNNEILFQKIFILFDLAALQSVFPFGSAKKQIAQGRILVQLAADRRMGRYERRLNI